MSDPVGRVSRCECLVRLPPDPQRLFGRAKRWLSWMSWQKCEKCEDLEDLGESGGGGCRIMSDEFPAVSV